MWHDLVAVPSFVELVEVGCSVVCCAAAGAVPGKTDCFSAHAPSCSRFSQPVAVVLGTEEVLFMSSCVTGGDSSVICFRCSLASHGVAEVAIH